MSFNLTASEPAMDYACWPTAQPFRDLRSARKARHRERTHMEKYNHFRPGGLRRGDLPSFQGQQQAHYLPICNYQICSTQGTADGCWCSTFPADLSTAPVAKFTKRQAYQEAQLWPRPPTYHRSVRHWKYNNKRIKQNHEKNIVGKELRARVWYDDLPTGSCCEDFSCLSAFDRYCYFHADAEWYESEEDDVREHPWDPIPQNGPVAFEQMDGDSDDEGYCSSGEPNIPTSDVETLFDATVEPAANHLQESNSTSKKPWFWHRNFAGGWFRAGYGDHYWHACTCETDSSGDQFDQNGTAFPLSEWLGDLPQDDRESVSCITSTDDTSGSWNSKEFAEVWDWTLTPFRHDNSSREGSLITDSGWEVLSDSSESWTELAASASSVGLEKG